MAAQGETQMNTQNMPGPAGAAGFWLDHPDHRRWLADDADRQFAFFAASMGQGAIARDALRR
mgnify:CR=1 FL=1